MAAGPWPKSAAELTFDKALGRGFFGEVWSCRFIADPARTPVAVKKIPISLIRQHNLTQQMEREIKILQSLDHKHIVRLFSDFRDESHVYLAMEFAQGGGMFDRLSKLGKFPLSNSAQYFYESCDALEYLHALPEKVIHRDIKPENILFDKEHHVKIADFGWSNVMQGVDTRGTFCGTPDYLAPEMIRGEGHNESLDMWEMGVLLYEMVVGKSPFGASTQEQTCRKILKCDLRFPSDMDPDAQDCITRLCKINPDERLTAKQSKAHVFVIKNFQGRPTDAIDAKGLSEEDDGAWIARPSVETRRLRRDKGLLEGEMKNLLDAKGKLEGLMLDMTTELEDAYKQCRREKDRADKAEAELARLKGSAGYKK